MNQRRTHLCTLIAVLAIGCGLGLMLVPHSQGRGGGWELSHSALHSPSLSRPALAGCAPSLLPVTAATNSGLRGITSLPRIYLSRTPDGPVLPSSFQRPPPVQLA